MDFPDRIHLNIQAQTISLYHYHKAGEVAAYIRANTSQRNILSIDALGKRFGTCQTNLKKAFKHRFKTSVHQYIIQARIEKAKEMLCEQGLPVKEIAWTLGYPEIGNLTRDFKKITGLPPTQYRHENGRRQFNPDCHSSQM